MLGMGQQGWGVGVEVEGAAGVEMGCAQSGMHGRWRGGRRFPQGDGFGSGCGGFHRQGLVSLRGWLFLVMGVMMAMMVLASSASHVSSSPVAAIDMSILGSPWDGPQW